MSALDVILARARAAGKCIVLPEGEDPRIAEAALRAQRDGLARTVVLGRETAVRERLAAAGAKDGEVDVVDPASDARRADYAAAFHELRRHKGVDEAAADKAMSEPLGFAAMMVRKGDADGTLGGAVATTGDVLRAALTIVGRASGVSTVSSFFLMQLGAPHHPLQGTLAFADCGLVVEPTSEELATIATSTAASFADLVGDQARVALLSFSTAGSAKHTRVTRVADAVTLVREQAPGLVVDGELQFDAAFVPAVAKAKAPDSTVGGRANVFVFPSLEAANIGYKIAQRIGGAGAFGPILQGLAKPANDLSRGCDADDAYHMIAVTAAQC